MCFIHNKPTSLVFNFQISGTLLMKSHVHAGALKGLCFIFSQGLKIEYNNHFLFLCF